MKQLPQVLFWLGLISIPFAWLVWYVGPQMEMVRPVLASISDPALRAALQEAHAERLGLSHCGLMSALARQRVLPNLYQVAKRGCPRSLCPRPAEYYNA